MKSVTVHHGDSREVLKGMADCSIDSVVCDPPYALTSINKRFSKSPRTESTMPTAGPYARASRGFMGQTWDTGETAFDPEFWAEVLRVLKPGGYVVAFSSSRTGHWQACAMEQAGFVMHPFLAWIFGSGFPKAHNAAKAIDRELGTPGAVAAKGAPVRRIRPGADQNKVGWEKLEDRQYQPGEYVPGSDEAAQWLGWAYGGQALKPAMEPIYVGQRPFSEKNGAANIMEHGTGALNIDGCRVEGEPVPMFETGGGRKFEVGCRDQTVRQVGVNSSGRWPANVVHDGSDEVLAAFPDLHGAGAAREEPGGGSYDGSGGIGFAKGGAGIGVGLKGFRLGDSGSAARFFYSVEPDALCDLCRCSSGGGNGSDKPCNANTAESSSPTPNTLIADTALSGAAGSQRRGRGAKPPASSATATGAGSPSSRPPQTASDIAAEPAPTPGQSSLVQNVRSAGNLCGSCATAIAQSLAATRRGQDPASRPCPAYMPARNWQILSASLALYVAGREHIDTITTTESLKTLLGSALHAIAATTSSERAASGANTNPDQRRFHYSSKADAEDRLGSKHPTVKPVDLMAYLCRLVTPPGGTILDPFAGTGTTGLAAMREGFDCILIEREAEYIADIERRLAWARGEGRLTAQETARGKIETHPGPLFGGEAA